MFFFGTKKILPVKITRTDNVHVKNTREKAVYHKKTRLNISFSC